MDSTIKVSVNGKVKEYRQMIAEFGNFLANDGYIVSLWEARQQSRHFFRNMKSDVIRALSFWVILD